MFRGLLRVNGRLCRVGHVYCLQVMISFADKLKLTHDFDVQVTDGRRLTSVRPTDTVLYVFLRCADFRACMLYVARSNVNMKFPPA